MFDFDYEDLETADPAPDPEKEKAQAAAEAAQLLADEAFTVRRDAVRSLGRLGLAAGPYLAQLVETAESDHDYEVRRAAKQALRSLRQHGLSAPREDATTVALRRPPNEKRTQVTTGASRPPEEGAVSFRAEPPDEPEQLLEEWTGPKVCFDINGQLLDMCLEKEAVTPAEVAEIWERCPVKPFTNPECLSTSPSTQNPASWAMAPRTLHGLLPVAALWTGGLLFCQPRASLPTVARRKPWSRLRPRGHCAGAEFSEDEAADEVPGGISWLPPLNISAPDETAEGRVLPVFPLGGAYFPFAQPELSIFEPRYRQLYNDILVSGGRSFVVVAPSPEDENVFAEVGVVFYLDDLTDVSEESADEVKYICNHRILGRVRILRVLNPAAWEDQSTYLLAEVEDFKDVELASDTNTAAKQAEVMSALSRVAQRQEEGGGPHFESHISDYANASCAQEGGLWTLADVFAEYYEYLLSDKEQTLDFEMEQVYERYSLEEEGDDRQTYSLASEDDDDDDDFEYEEIDIMELPGPARREIARLQNQYEEEAALLNADLMHFVHSMLQSTSHRQRLEIMQEALLLEERRLAARKALEEVMYSGD
ncbi:hypothetical protein AK812_SmicGene18024 [Symbiodinium microadriaticum]|uniref:Uncharacterized protein n=1 Tax=Symbiodinium microadriaticum TaxID=2951 RepID=A0A1Q9DWA6_SYMMI|nr:hypothetical protein AK812_SmicGene18024 [Symbiodinium microadriaticum]CAE7226306.1 unnamed protein product [Symbiodinium microadriaticum]CAE7371597.1 unnamed protein product [Symbiodinium sp. KB8]